MLHLCCNKIFLIPQVLLSVSNAKGIFIIAAFFVVALRNKTQNIDVDVVRLKHVPFVPIVGKINNSPEISLAEKNLDVG